MGHLEHVGNETICSEPYVAGFGFDLAVISHLQVVMKNSLNSLLLRSIREDIYSAVIWNVLVLSIYGF